MDFQKFVDGFKTMTCIISVEKFPDGSYGNIRIVAGNKAYIESIEGSPYTPKMLTNKFIPNSDYQLYLQKDLNFEDFCYRCAILKQPLHTYVHPDRFDFWFNIFMLPLDCDEENICYCTYSQELSREADTSQMSNLSQQVASDVLNSCIKMRGSEDFKTKMAEVIKDIRVMCRAKYCFILQMDFTNRTCSLLGESMFSEPGMARSLSWFCFDFFDIADSFEDTIAGSNCLIIKNKHDMEFVKERNPIWYDSLQKSGIERIALFPIKKGDELLGYIWVTEFDEDDSVRIKSTLELTTYFVASEIHNHQLFEKLRILSTMDMLTGVFNRNEMNNRVYQLVSENDEQKTSLGVVFTDLNCLKQVNDNKGHDAGDTLLKNAASMLKIVFGGSEIFRAGGDEFLIMIRGSTRNEIEQLVDQLKKQSDASGAVSFAVGYEFVEDSRNVRIAMKSADEKMYADKNQFYKDRPGKKRR